MLTKSDGPVRLVLHPGHPKCGSSTIQDALRLNSDTLASRGIFYPAVRPNRVFIDACESQDFSQVEAWLSAVLGDLRRAGCDTLIISSENLGVRQLVSAGRQLHELFAGVFRPVQVVYYLRRQDDWLISMWQQWGHKSGKRLEQFVDDRLNFHEPGYVAAAQLFEQVYGVDQVTAAPIHREALADGDLVADFSKRAGIGPLPVADPERFRNPSMSGFLCDVLARVPDVYDQSIVAQVAVGRTDHSVRRLLEGYVSTDLLLNRDKRVMSLEERRRILAFFDDDNRWLHARYFPGIPFETVFGTPERTDDEAVHDLRAHVEGLADVVAMQMQAIVDLLRERETRKFGRRIRSFLDRVRRRLRAVVSRSR